MALAVLCFHVRSAAFADGVAPTPGGGGVDQRISLNETIALAIRQNPTLAKSTSDVGIADARVLEAAGVDDFIWDGSSSWLSNRTELLSGQSGQPIFDKLSVGTGLTRPLPTGGRIGLRIGTDYSRFGAASGSGADTSQAYTPSLLLTFTHPLLRGAGVDVARAGRRRAHAGKDVAALQREATLANVLRDVSQAYWELAYATAELEIRRSSLELAREQLRVLQANISVGKQPPSASAEVEVAIALREEEVLLAEQALRSQSLELRRLLGLELGPDQGVLTAADQPETQLREPDPDHALDAAMEANPALQSARAQRRAAGIDVEVTDNGLLPQLDLAVNAGPIGNSDDPSKAFTQLAGFSGYTVQAGLVFSQSLGRRAAHGQANVARESLRKARLTEAEISAQLQVGVLTNVDLVRTARQRLEVLAKATDLAALDLEAERARFAVGRGSNFDVLRRQGDLARSQLRQVRAKTDYLKSLAALDALTAEILPRHGIKSL